MTYEVCNPNLFIESVGAILLVSSTCAGRCRRWNSWGLGCRLICLLDLRLGLSCCRLVLLFFVCILLCGRLGGLCAFVARLFSLASFGFRLRGFTSLGIAGLSSSLLRRVRFRFCCCFRSILWAFLFGHGLSTLLSASQGSTFRRNLLHQKEPTTQLSVS